MGSTGELFSTERVVEVDTSCSGTDTGMFWANTWTEKELPG